MQGDQLASTLRSFLAEAPTLSLATVGDDGHPHAANVNFVADDALDLYFVSDPATAHAQHVAARPRIAATIYTPFAGPSFIRGVQLHGDCAPIPAECFDEIWSAFCAKFAYAAAFEARARAERFYRVRPMWFRWIDNSVKFGFKAETNWPM